MNDFHDAVNALRGKTVRIANAGHAASGPRSSGTVPEWLTPGEFLNRHHHTTAVHKFRSWDDDRRFIPIIWWNGREWTMSVHGPHDEHHTRCSHSWAEAMGYGHTWARINRGAGLL